MCPRPAGSPGPADITTRGSESLVSSRKAAATKGPPAPVVVPCSVLDMADTSTESPATVGPGYRTELTRRREAVDAAREAFEDYVVEVWRVTGASMRELGDAAGLSRSRVHQIVTKYRGVG